MPRIFAIRVADRFLQRDPPSPPPWRTVARITSFFLLTKLLGNAEQSEHLRLVIQLFRSMLDSMQGKLLLPLATMLVFALTRIPGMLPPSFSAAYAVLFCAGVYFSGRWAWWLPLGTLLVTDIGLDVYYVHLGWHVFDLPTIKYQLINYAAYLGLIWMGRRFKPHASFLALLGGGVLGAMLFYLLTNTASWLLNPFGNPEYTRNLLGWLTSLTKGTAGWPQTWEFFRNTLLSGGIFTGLFVGAMKFMEAAESPREKEPQDERAPEAEPAEEQPDEANA